jgi:hypothetical protein
MAPSLRLHLDGANHLVGEDEVPLPFLDAIEAMTSCVG